MKIIIYQSYTPRKLTWLARKSTMNEDVPGTSYWRMFFFPACHVSFGSFSGVVPIMIPIWDSMNKFLPPTWLSGMFWGAERRIGLRSGVHIKVLPHFNCEKSDDIMAFFLATQSRLLGRINLKCSGCKSLWGLECVVIYFIIFHCGLWSCCFCSARMATRLVVGGGQQPPMVRWRGVIVLVTILSSAPWQGFTGGLWLQGDRHTARRATGPQGHEDAVKSVLQQVSRMNNDELERLVEDTVITMGATLGMDCDGFETNQVTGF